MQDFSLPWRRKSAKCGILKSAECGILSLVKTIRLISLDCQVHNQMTKMEDGCNSKEVFCCFSSNGAFSSLAVNCHLIKVRKKKKKKVGPLKGLLLMFPENQWHHC